MTYIIRAGLWLLDLLIVAGVAGMAGLLAFAMGAA